MMGRQIGLFFTGAMLSFISGALHATLRVKKRNLGFTFLNFGC